MARTTILEQGGATALVIGALSLAVYVFGRVTRRMEEHKVKVEEHKTRAAQEGNSTHGH